MSDEYGIDIPEKKRSITEKYRLAVIDEEDLKEVRSFRVSMLNIYMAISTLILVVGFLFLSLLIFTPLKRFIPGYGDVSESREYRELKIKMSEVEEALDVQATYNESLRKMLQGNISGDVKIDRNKLSIPPTAANKANSISAEDIGNEQSTKMLGSLFFVPPVTGNISSGFLEVEDHLGVDILAKKNTPIKSIMEGIVVFSDWTMDAGNTLSIQHPNNIISVYKHNSVLLKKAGDRVNPGEAVAIIGNSGTLSDGPHLHFELWYEGLPVDPEKYITF